MFLEPEPQGAWADGLAAGNGYGFAAGNPVLASDAEGEAVVVLVLVLIFVAGTGAIAHFTQNKTAMSFSPSHNLVRGIMGHEINDPADKVEGLERFLALIDVPLTLLSLGGAAPLKIGSRLRAAALAGQKLATHPGGQLAGKVASHFHAPLTARQLARARLTIVEARAAWIREGRSVGDLLRWRSRMPQDAMGAFMLIEGAAHRRIYLNKILLEAPFEVIERVFAHEMAHVKFALGLGRVAERIQPFATTWLRVDPYRYQTAVKWIDEALAYGVEFGSPFDFARAMQSMSMVRQMAASSIALDIEMMGRAWLRATAVGKAGQLGVSFASRD